MPLASALGAQSGLIKYEEWQSAQEDKAKRARTDDDEDEGALVLTAEEKDRYEIIRFVTARYDEARRAREPNETFDIAWDLFIGNVWPRQWPTWRAKITINKIRAFITFMQAIMTDNKPRISVEPLVPGTEDAADLLRKLVDRDWDDNNMQQKLTTFVLYGLIWGTAFMKIAYDPYADGGRGKHTATPVVPYRIFTNRTATCIEDAEYIIQVEEMTMGWVRRNFPDKARVVSTVRSARISDKRERDRDFIREGDFQEQGRIISAQTVAGNVSGPQYAAPNPQYQVDDGDVVEIMECWMRDDRLEQYSRQKVVSGQPQFEPEKSKDGELVLETVGQRVVASEIDGQPFMFPIMRAKMKPVMETAWRAKFPNGRLVMIAGGTVLLRDVPNPLQISDIFPYAMWKDYDVGAFWGQGEPLALKDCEIAKNRIASQIYDILEKTGNPSFKLKKGAGVNAQSIKNKPGSIIPMDEMDALQPLDKPPMPPQFFELFNLVSKAMGDISGVNDSVMGQLPAANTAFATMDQLQESGAAPIRLKVRNLETGITRIGKLRIELIQQHDKGDRPIRERNEPREPVTEDGDDSQAVMPAEQVQVQFRKYTKADLQGAVEFGVVPISSLSTSPAGAWNRWMDMYSKHLVDRRWWHDKFRVEGWRTELPRMEATEKAEAAAAQAGKDAKKPGPAPKRQPGNARRRPAPPSNVPSRQANASVR